MDEGLYWLNFFEHNAQVLESMSDAELSYWGNDDYSFVGMEHALIDIDGNISLDF